MIPYKLFEHLIADLIEFRTDPCISTDNQLMQSELQCNWPYAASQTQLDDWQNACDRTRAEFEAKLGKSRK